MREARRDAPARLGFENWIALGRRPLAVPVLLAAILVLVLFAGPSRREDLSASRPGQGQAILAWQHATSGDFKVLRAGSEVRIEWPESKPNHRVQRANDPLSIRAAAHRDVKGRVWSEPAGGEAPGSVTYYLID